MFKSGKTYSSATVFVKDAEKLVVTNFYDSNSSEKNDQYLSKDELEALKDTTTSSKATTRQSTGKVTIVGLTSTADNSDTIKYPNGIKNGDNAVLTLSYSTDATNIDISQLENDGWKQAYKKDMGKGDRVILIMTKEMNGNEDNKSYTIPTKNGKNDVSAQMTVLRNATIDTKNIQSNAADGSKPKTIFNKNSRNTNAPAYLHVAMADDPADYENTINMDYFGASYSEGDAGVTFVSYQNNKYELTPVYKDGGGRQDLILNIPIVFEQ
jgi:co-chaperonin GroES (HSP10)